MSNSNGRSTDLIKKYTPSFRFHPNEKFFPSSIEYLVQGATLHYQNFDTPAKTDASFGSRGDAAPGICFFNGYAYMAWKDVGTKQLKVAKSRWGWDWQDARAVSVGPEPSGNAAAVPALAVFKEKLYLVYADAKESALWVSGSDDGLAYSPARKIDRQWSLSVALAAFEGNLVMAYRDSQGTQLWMTQSSDGISWSIPTKIENRNATGTPALAVFQQKLCMIFPAHNDSRLWVSTYTSSSGWSGPSNIPGQSAKGSPSLAVIGGWLCVVYRNKSGGQIWCSRSPNVSNWQDTSIIPDLKTAASDPAVVVTADKLIIVYVDDAGSQIMYTRCPNGDFAQHAPITNITQDTLRQNNGENWFININPSQYPGQPIPQAPMYYAVQDFDDALDITYIVLYPYQGPQTVRARRAGSEFNCLLPNLGTHQGDLEHVTISLAKGPDGSLTIRGVTYEAHGKAKEWTPDWVKWEDGTHAIVHVILNSHGHRNTDPDQCEHDFDVNIPGAVAVGNWVGRGPWWRPYSDGSEFKQLGLDGQGNPIGDQIWAAYAGKLGETRNNGLVGATYFDGTKVKSTDRAFIQIVFGVGNLVGAIPQGRLVGNGPAGPAQRHWIKPGQGKRPTNV